MPLFYWIGIALLLSVEFWGESRLGAKRWISIPFLETTIQPSEVIKPVFILMIGYLVHNRPPQEMDMESKILFIFHSIFFCLLF